MLQVLRNRKRAVLVAVVLVGAVWFLSQHFSVSIHARDRTGKELLDAYYSNVGKGQASTATAAATTVEGGSVVDTILDQQGTLGETANKKEKGKTSDGDEGGNAVDDDIDFSQEKSALDNAGNRTVAPISAKRGEEAGDESSKPTAAKPDAAEPSHAGNKAKKNVPTGEGSGRQWCVDGHKPQTGIKYIKTHKTGSSTLTNIFHRYGEIYELKMALPRDNLFYGWPGGSASIIPSKVEHIGGRKPPYDIMASGHVMYIKEGLNAVVPHGTFITVLRNPVTHFKSSWFHWHVHEHIKANGGPMLTPLEFLKDFAKYKGFMRWSDQILVLNNMAYDLGVKTPTEEGIRDLIADMDEEFGTVLITEYMAESLVLMKRRLCWTLKDVLHLSLKVSSGTHSQVANSELTQMEPYLRELNWADFLLYDHFNKTLWHQISLEKNFNEEVAELKSMIKDWSDKCRKFQNYDEDAHRVQLEERDNVSEENRLCHYMMLDSKGFVKHLKKRDGYSIEKLECWATHFNTKILHLVMDSPADDQLFNLLASNSGVASKLAVEDPDSASFSVPDGYLVSPPSAIYTTFGASTFSIRGLSYNRDFMDSLYHGMMYIAVFRDPVQEFLDAWTKLGIADKMRSMDRLVEVSETKTPLDFFLDDTEGWLTRLSTDGFNAKRQLMNRIAYRMGLSLDPTSDEWEHALTHIWWFSIILIAEYPDMSMVMLRRTLCWRISDVIAYDHDTWMSSNKYKLSDYTSRAVEMTSARINTLNTLDQQLYRRARDSFLAKIDKQVSFQDELLLFREKRGEFISQCARSPSDEACVRIHQSRNEIIARPNFLTRKTANNFTPPQLPLS